MLAAAVTAQVQIPLVAFLLHMQFVHALLEHIQTLFPLAAADQLADIRHQQVRCRDGLAVIVHAHVEGLDVLRVVGQEQRSLDDLLAQIALMLALEVHAPVDVIVLKLGVRLLQDLNRFRILHAPEFAVAHMVQALQQVLVDEFIEELHLFRAVVHDVVDAVLDHVLDQLHVIVEIRKRDLRLDHPEFGGVGRRVGVLGAEGRSERVDVAERQRKGLRLQLAGDGQRSVLAEKVLLIMIILAGRDREGLAGALGIVAGDQRRVHIDEALVLEELMDRHGQHGADAEDRRVGVRARTQMRDLTQIFKGMALLLQRIGGIAGAFAHDLRHLDLKGLLVGRRLLVQAGHLDGGAGQIFGNVIEIGQCVGIDELRILEVRAVVEFDEADLAAGAVGADPSFERHVFNLVFLHIRAFVGQLVKLAHGHITQHTFFPFFYL